MMDDASKVQMFQVMWPAIAIVGVSGMFGWVVTTWMRIKNGYPLDGAWGKPLHPIGGGETAERVKLLTQENAQLRAELGSIKDRLATVERIVTDDSHKLTREIESLRGPAN